MAFTRLMYISENHIDPAYGSRLRQLGDILSVSNRNNRRDDLTGALVFDDGWFLQCLEGPGDNVWQSFERIRQDERHAKVKLIEFAQCPDRLFGNWWMGLATRTPSTEAAFAPYMTNGMLQAASMSGADILSLMLAVSRGGLRREMKAA